MFSNVGRKIKIYAIICCVLGMLFSVGGAITLIVLGVNYSLSYLIGIGILVAILGTLSAWISSLFIFGYGKLIEDTAKTNELLKTIALLQK